MSQEDLLAVAETVAGLMPRLARGLASPAKDPADDLPLAQLRLCGILTAGPRAMSALSRELGVSLSALTQIADRLERSQLVKRVAEEGDRRVRCLQLTARGEKMMRKRREARVLRAQAVLERLTLPQREAVRTSLEILVDACAALQAGEQVCAATETTGEAAPSAKVKTANGHTNNHHPQESTSKASKSKVTS